MRRLLGSALALALVLQLGQFVAGPAVRAAGTANCNPDGNRWKGHAVQGSGQVHGVSGTFEGQHMKLCDNPGISETSGSFVLSNITPSNGGFNDIVQIGMGSCRVWFYCGDRMRYYSGWGRTESTPGCAGEASRFPTVVDEGDWVDASHDYKVYHQNNWWRMFVDQVEYLAVHEDEICWTPKIAVWFGEALDAGDQIGGTAANPFGVTATNYAAAENGGFGWTTFNANDPCNYGNPPPYRCDVTGTKSLTIWTAR